MTLNKQLLCVSLLLLSLPWAGYEYLQDMSQALQQRQMQALSANTRMVAQALGISQPPQAFHPQRPLLTPSDDPLALLAPQAQQQALYCHRAQTEMRADGYQVDQEWAAIPWRDYPLVSSLPSAASTSFTGRLSYRCAVDADQLYLLLQVGDDEIHYHNPAALFSRDESEIARTRAQRFNGDRLILHTGTGRSYVLTAISPGRVHASYPTSNAVAEDVMAPASALQAELQGWRNDDSVTAFWSEAATAGYQLEISIPRQRLAGRLELSVVDVDSQRQQLYGRALIQPPTASPFWYLYPADGLQQLLVPFAQPDIRLHLLSPQGLRLATVGSPRVQDSGQVHWLVKRFYRFILGDNASQRTPYVVSYDMSNRTEVRAALSGRAGDYIYGAGRRALTTSAGARAGLHTDQSHQPLLPDATPLQQGEQMLASAVPVHLNGDSSQPLLALVVAEQSNQQVAALTDHAFNRLFLFSLSVFAGGMLVLLLYASWLSWRIRKLSRATQRALAERGALQPQIPRSRASDEIGQLTRQYGELMGRVDEYTAYLQGLSGKLSHELRTPLAIIHSSLDNLSGRSLDVQQHKYVLRAQEGAQRLGQLITAMSEARRVEESIEQAEPEVCFIDRLLVELSQAYQDLYTQQVVLQGIDASAVDRQEAQYRIIAVPDLLVQMLDKLLDNAQSFCPPGGRILICYEDLGPDYRLVVSNDGPLLPQAMQSQLFDTLVSVRSDRQGNHHLGMGLYIVQLIVRYHQGQVRASNRHDGSGVEFIIQCPKAALPLPA